MQLYTLTQIRTIEKYAIEQCAIPEFDLMQSAGQAAWQQCHAIYPLAKKVVVVCGPGNNGGDGFVFAHAAKSAGMQVNIIMLTKPPTQGVAGKAFQACQRAGVAATEFTATLAVNADVIIDALFGIGLTRQVEGEFATAIAWMNAHPAPIFAMDTPSGIDLTSGKVLGCASKAQHTLTFIGNKMGFYLGEAREYCGDIHVHDLNIPSPAFARVKTDTSLMRWNDFQGVLPPRKTTAHKGNFGHVLVVGGDYGYAGAACMAGSAAARTGAGLVSIATRPEHAASLFVKQPELMAHAINHANDMQPLIERANVIAIGPGLGHSDWAHELAEVVFQCGKPLIVDADALTLLAQTNASVAQCVLTPHPGEAARLLDMTSDQVQQDRLAAVHHLADRFQAVAVLKGANTLIKTLDKQIHVCDAGNPGMASGGMGDVLSGVIAGLIAQGVDINSAAMMGVQVHAMAGDRASAAHGRRGILATDLLPHIQNLINE